MTPAILRTARALLLVALCVTPAALHAAAPQSSMQVDLRPAPRRLISLEEIRSATQLGSGIEATQRFGTNHGHGAILVETGPQG
jgi:hypothetical protein